MDSQMIGPAHARAARPLRLSLFGDERLARLVAGDGNERAFATLYQRYHQPLYRYCRSMLGNDPDAQDALQSTLTGALVALRRGQRDAPLRPWLFRIAHNESVSLLRRRRPELELAEMYEGSTVSVEERVEERGRLALLVADLCELPERQRGALVMRELSGLSHADIAAALGVSVGAAKQTIFEARRSLLDFSEGRAMACEEIRRAISDGDGRVLRGRRVRAHLRDCAGCAAFAVSIPARRADLRALAPPLPAVTAAGLFARLVGAGSGHGGGGAGGLAAGAAGKTVAATLAAKSLAGVAIVAVATVGVTTALRHPARTTHASPAERTAPTGHAGAAARGPSLASPALSSRAGALRPGENHGEAANRAARAPVVARGRSAGQSAAAATGVRAAGMGGSHSVAGARGHSSVNAHGSLTRGAQHPPAGSAGSHSAEHRGGPSTSVSPGSRRSTATSGPARRANAPTGSASAMPVTSAVPATTSSSAVPALLSGSGQSHSRAG